METEHTTLESLLLRLNHLSSDHLKLYGQLMAAADHNVYTWDLLVTGVLDRSMSLIRGFATLIPDNYVCAAPLVRLQLDNLLRFTASFLVDNPEDFTTKVMRGERIEKMKAQDGQRMTDRYLVEQIELRQPGIKYIYKHGSGHVHFSDFHIFSPVRGVDDETMAITWEISGKDKRITDQMRADAILTVISITEAFLGQVAYYITLKNTWPRVR